MRLRRWLLALLAVVVVGLSCAPGFEPASKVIELRVLAVTADRPYALPGEEVTLRMTVADGFGDEDGNPRPLQILWLAGCFNPEGDQYFRCFEQLADVLGPAVDGGEVPADLVRVDFANPSSDGAPDAHAFTFTIPEDIVESRPVPEDGPHYGIAYVFFAACAGRLAPAPFEQLGTTVPEFPIQCLDGDGNPLGPESFVPGYTQVYAFADGRLNAIPPTEGITLDGELLPSDPAEAPLVTRCPVTAAERRAARCGRDSPVDECRQYAISAIIPDVAERMPDANDEGEELRETVWVSYFTDAGDLDDTVRLVSDAREGYLAEHRTEWTPPAEPGLVQLWAVTRDQRGGVSVTRAFVRVE